MSEKSDNLTQLINALQQFEELKEKYKSMKETVTALLREFPVDTMFQDHTTGVVYKIVVPTGTFVSFDTISYVRTRKAGEDKGTLSIKEASAAGFKL